MAGKDRKKVLFIDRDGVIVNETQVDSFEKIVYIPHVFEAMREISRRGDYLLVMVSNQDGVGTPLFPYEDYIGPAERIFDTLRGEGIVFDDIHIDFSLPEENSPMRKPGTGMIDSYRSDEYDMSKSFVIGDRITDMMLARNMGCRGFLLNGPEVEVPEDLVSTVVMHTSDWLDIAAYLVDDKSLAHRKASVSRKTLETDIDISIDVDGTGVGKIITGIGFFDHMMDQVVRHSRFDASGSVKGDLDVDFHHTVEDTALALGSAVLKALGDKRGIERYGSEIVMMDDTVATAAIDFSGRPEFIFDAEFSLPMIGDFPSELIRHFFRSFAAEAKCNLYLSARKGGDSHHTAEALFKAFARAMRKAVKRIPGDSRVASTKGVL